jgi:hypothetical protein
MPTPCAFQVLDHVEQHHLLRIGQRGGRFVEDDGLGVDGQRPRDLDHLLVGDGQVADPGPRVEPDLELAEDLVRSGIELLPVDPAEALFRQLAEIDVLRHGQFLGEAQLLVDEHDALRLRLQRRGHHHRLLADDDAAFVGLVDTAEHLHQRGLAGAVLAHQGVNLARHDREGHPSSARTPGKVLTMPSRGGRAVFVSLIFQLLWPLRFSCRSRNRTAIRIRPITRLTVSVSAPIWPSPCAGAGSPVRRPGSTMIRSLAAGEFRAAQNHGGDHPELVEHRRHWGSRTRFGIEDHGGQRGQEADDHEVDHHVRTDADAGIDRRLAIVADGIGVAPVHVRFITNQITAVTAIRNQVAV